MTTPEDNKRIDGLVEAWADLLLAHFRAAGVYLRRGYGLPPIGPGADWIMPRAIARAFVLYGREVGLRGDMVAIHVVDATRNFNVVDLELAPTGSLGVAEQMCVDMADMAYGRLPERWTSKLDSMRERVKARACAAGPPPPLERNPK
jgi:hypothetical protein